jgi:hypothetical protein
LYYFNTFDGAGEIDIDKMNETQTQQIVIEDTFEEECESCTI